MNYCNTHKVTTIRIGRVYLAVPERDVYFAGNNDQNWKLLDLYGACLIHLFQVTTIRIGSNNTV